MALLLQVSPRPSVFLILFVFAPGLHQDAAQAKYKENISL